MLEEIVVLTGEIEGPHLTEALKYQNPALRVFVATTADELQTLMAPPHPGRRLVSFCAGVVVGAELLEGLSGPAYNFHPGSPEFPGSCSASFAIYEGAERFAATAHEMRAKVDSGPIVATSWFDVPPGSKYVDLELMTYERLLKLFHRLAPHLAMDNAPLPATGEQWSGPTRTKAEAERLRAIEADLSEEEIKRRYYAFG